MPPAILEGVPEKRLLVACARTQMTPDAARRIREIVAGAIDWDYLLQAAAENSVLPLVALHLPTIASDRFTPEQIERLKNAARAAGIRILQYSAELIRVIDALGHAGVLGLPYKGPIVAEQAYGDLGLREFDDLDIIVRQRDIVLADRVLRGLDYQPRVAWLVDHSALVPGEYKYSNAARCMIVELHTERTLRHIPVPPDLDRMSKQAMHVAVGGRELRTFAAEDTLVLLCVHGSKDFWERLSWITDVSEFIQRNSELDWVRVFKCADELKATRMVLLGLALASGLLDAPLPEGAATRIKQDATVLMLAANTQKAMLAKEGSGRSALESFRYRRQMIAGVFASWRYGLRLATAPCEEDWLTTPLPRVLAPFYVLLRPFRLLRKYRVSNQDA